MKGRGVWPHAVSHWLVAWLISRWGAAVVLIGTMALAGSASVYLTSAYDHPAPTGVSVPSTVTSIPAQSLCAPVVVGGALTCTGMFPAQCTPPLLIVAPDIACDDR